MNYEHIAGAWYRLTRPLERETPKGIAKRVRRWCIDNHCSYFVVRNRDCTIAGTVWTHRSRVEDGTITDFCTGVPHGGATEEDKEAGLWHDFYSLATITDPSCPWRKRHAHRAFSIDLRQTRDGWMSAIVYVLNPIYSAIKRITSR